MLSDLNDLIMEARESLDNADRIPKYHDAQDLVMELAIELPTYQRTDLYIYNTKVLDESTFYFGADGKPNIYNGLLSRIWEVDFVK
jgi:ABC-type transport system substrate-binding protein